MTTNGNKLTIQFESKNFKVRLGKIGVVVHANKMARPWMEKSNFIRMNSRLLSHLGEGELDYKA